MRAVFYTSVSAIGLAFTAPAYAQDISDSDTGATSAANEADPDELGANVILVTAQRRSERLQDVPIAISAYSSEKRDDLGILSVQDIAKFTPGASFSEFPNRFFLRGVGRFTNQLGTDPGVATYVDGFYTSETQAIAGSPIQIERVEVLRGPQGTLFGRNAIGGAVNVISKRPTDDFELEVRMGLGSFDLITGSAAISGPITDGLRFRVSGSSAYQGDGLLDNISGDDAYYRVNTDLIEGQLEADLGSRGEAWVKYQYFTADNGPTLNNQIDPFGTTTFFSGSSLVPSPTFGFTVPNPGADDLFKADLDFAGFERIPDSHQVVGSLSWDFGGVTAKYIGGYQTFDFIRSIDADGTSRAGYLAPDGTFISSFLVNDITTSKEFYSHELTLTSNTDGPFQYILGAYYYNEDETQGFVTRSPNQPELGFILAPPTFATGFPNPDRSFVDLRARQQNESYAFFGQVDIELTPEINLTGGLRYTKDKKDGFESRENFLFNPFIVPGFGLDVTPALSEQDRSGEWDAVTGKVGVAWQPNRTTNMYASYSRGYKAGGFNLFSFTDEVQEESIDAFEVGLKKSIPGLLEANLAAFYYDYRDLQVPVRFVDVVILQNFVNAPRARSFGAEAELVLTPTDSLQFILSYSYLNAEFREFSGFLDITNPGAGPQDLRGNSLPQAPEHKVTFNASNRFDLGGGISITPVATLNYTDEQFFSPFTTDFFRADDFLRADFRLIVKSDDGLQLNAFVNNAFNERSFNGFDVGGEAGGFARLVTFNLPRTYGIELIGKF